jgi:hypothetical protein
MSEYKGFFDNHSNKQSVDRYYIMEMAYIIQNLRVSAEEKIKVMFELTEAYKIAIKEYKETEKPSTKNIKDANGNTITLSVGDIIEVHHIPFNKKHKAVVRYIKEDHLKADKLNGKGRHGLHCWFETCAFTKIEEDK